MSAPAIGRRVVVADPPGALALPASESGDGRKPLDGRVMASRSIKASQRPGNRLRAHRQRGSFDTSTRARARMKYRKSLVSIFRHQNLRANAMAAFEIAKSFRKI